MKPIKHYKYTKPLTKLICYKCIPTKNIIICDISGQSICEGETIKREEKKNSLRLT